MMSKSTLTALLSATLMASCAAGQAKPSDSNLSHTEWLLEDLGGKGVAGRAQATLAFPEAGKVSGMASCNRFFGTVEIKGDTIHFSRLGSTQMACQDEAISRQEADYLDALQNADRFSREGPYLLIHAKGWAKPLRFTRIQPKNPSPESAD